MNRIGSALVLSTLCAGVSACGGGGGGGSTPAGPTPAPGCTQGTLSVAPAGGAGSFAVESVPAGLPVTIANPPNGTRSATTPTTATPLASNQATTISVQPSNGAPAYTFIVDQRTAAARTLLFDQCADTSGSLASVSTTGAARKLSSAQTFDASRLPRFAPQRTAARPQFSATRLIVRYHTDALRSAASRGIDVERAVGVARGVDLGRSRGGFTTRVVEAGRGDTFSALAARLQARSEVASVSRERLYYKQSASPVSVNDTYFANTYQWGLFKIATPNAWGYATGLPGTGVSIALVDTGADMSAPDLQGKISFAEAVINGTTTTGTSAAQDTDGHGTNIAGIAAADTNNGNGVAGVGYNATLQIYKVFPNGTATDTPAYQASANEGDVITAINDAVTHGANIINLSLGTCQASGSDAEDAAIQNALAHNVVVVAAAGNERSGGGTGACAGSSSTIDYPAADNGVISVGASKLIDTTTPGDYTTATEAVASYSNSGPGLSLVAPGGDPSTADQTAANPDLLHWIFGLYTSTSADPSVHCALDSQGNCLALIAGTSQATPHVSGVAALMLAAHPGMTPAQVKQTLIATADDIGDPNQGGGRLDAYRALAAATGDTSPPALPANINFVAFAYTPNGTSVPAIIDVTYPKGVPVARGGTFRVADILPTASGYKIGVWADVNGDGIVDAGDYFGTSGVCTASAPCASATGIVAHPVSSGFTLQ
ncbi:MAG: S8 family serine peptidase [Candidatus Eremiobacteraeota bacterium]|nr:S8 family serine peptidase [Candidatus Eremiobacteraeota bacterium]